MKPATPVVIALRYSRARSDNRFLSLMTLISLLGLTLGVVALIVVVSIMNGFDAELKRRILGAVPHVIVTGAEVSREELLNIDGVEDASRFSRQSALLINGTYSELVSLYGIDPAREESISIIPRHMVSGNLQQLSNTRFGIVLGKTLAVRLDVTPGDPLMVSLPHMENGFIRTVMLNARLTGTFQLDSDLDYGLALMDVGQLSDTPSDHGSQYRLKVNDIFAAHRVAQRVKQRHGGEVSDWTSDYGDFFRTVKMEKIMMFLMLLLIVGIAAFSIVSSLSMLVKEKQGDIAVLRTCGLSAGGVTMIFVVQGAMIGIIGVALGTVIGIPLASNISGVVTHLESLMGAEVLAGTYFDAVPSDVRYGDIALIVVVSLLISLAATIYPAYRAASVRPAEILRYE